MTVDSTNLKIPLATVLPFMKPDDDLCLCFHVSWRKVINHARVHRIERASQLSECFGAGTGCGWCRTQLERIAESVANVPPDPGELDRWLAENAPDRNSYVEGRQKYRAKKRDS